MESAKEAGKELVDVYTGVDDSFDKIVDGTKDLIESVTEYATETLKAADAIVEQEKAMVSLENQQVRIREAADRDAELQRQIRDDVTKGINDRIQANKDLGVVLEKQLQDEKKNIQSRIAGIRAENNGLGITQAKLDEIYALETELIAV
jgi:mevalonate kinase